ncbi:MAG: TonB C-terminal domain-containing protein [Gemmatimonadaceae bacterium]
MTAARGEPRGGARGEARLGVPIGVVLAAHAAFIAALFAARPERQPAPPPIYRVDIVAAPPGPRAIGEVRPPEPTPPPPTPTPAPPPTRAQNVPPAPAAPTTTPPPPARRPPPTAATPVPPSASAPKATDAPRAGGGPTGGRGSDVATVRTQGIEFPYPGYLSNIVRQIALRFSPRSPNAPLRAEMRFLIHRDGSVSDVAFVTRSGSYAFDLDAQGAVEAAADAKAFGPLPDGFRDDVLPVVFSFDPSLLR